MKVLSQFSEPAVTKSMHQINKYFTSQLDHGSCTESERCTALQVLFPLYLCKVSCVKYKTYANKALSAVAVQGTLGIHHSLTANELEK